MSAVGIASARAHFLLAVGVLFVASCALAGPEPRPLPPPPVDGRTGSEAAARPGGGPETPGRIAGAPTASEVRALWVVRTTLAHPDSVRAMVRRADRAGFNTLLVQVRGRGDAYYDSPLEPRAAALADAPGGYDPLALVVREARARGLAVHAWVNAHLVHGIGPLPVDRRHVVHARPEWLAVPRERADRLRRLDPRDPANVEALLEHARSAGLEGLYTSPAHPEVREHLLAVWSDLVERYDLDGLHLDYVRYPGPSFDYAPVALERFSARARAHVSPERARALDRAAAADPFAWPDGLPELWEDFRREQVSELVARTSRAVKARDPRLVVTAAVRADLEAARREVFQDWPAWLEAGTLDAVAPMAYTELDDLFGSWIRAAVTRSGGGRIWAGVGAYKTDFRGTVEQVRIARELGAGGVAIFSYDWAVAEARSDRPGDPFLRRVGEAAFGTR